MTKSLPIEQCLSTTPPIQRWTKATRSLLTPILIGASFFACSGLQPELTVASHGQAIVNGQQYSGHPAVGMLLTDSSLCTATLVGCKTVITAAHCVHPWTADDKAISCNSANKPANTVCDAAVGILRYKSVEVILGCNDLGGCPSGTTFQSTSVQMHPSYTGGSPFSGDLAIVTLARAPTVTPMVLSKKTPTVGRDLFLVGYGITHMGQSDSGIKRSGDAEIVDLTDSHFGHAAAGGSQSAVCSGDSGGPAFIDVNGEDRLLGIASYTIVNTSGATDDCGEGYHARLDIPWLESVGAGDIQIGTNVVSCVQPDVVAPTVLITSPANGAKFDGTQYSVDLEFDASDEGELTALYLYVDGRYEKFVAVDASSTKYKVGVTLAAGVHEIQISATDLAGNTASNTINVTVVAPEPTTPAPVDPGTTDPSTDAQAPKIWILSPNYGERVASALQILLQVQDEGGVQKIELFSEAVSGALALATGGANDQYSISVVLPVGAHSLRLMATDRSGNVSEEHLTLYVADAAANGAQITGGCSVGGESSPPWFASLLLFGLVVVSRRRSA